MMRGRASSFKLDEVRVRGTGTRKRDALLHVSVLKAAGYVTVPAGTTLTVKVETQGGGERVVEVIRSGHSHGAARPARRRCFARKPKIRHYVTPEYQARVEWMSRAHVYPKNADDCRQQAERCHKLLDKERRRKKNWMKMAREADDGHTQT